MTEPTSPADTDTDGGAPARQSSMFQAAAEPLHSLALLSLDLDTVARRLRLRIEESWDGHGTVRAAFFVLGGTDFVVTDHEGDPPGTNVWVRKYGPVGAAERMAVLLTALGVGEEAVSCSVWGRGTGLSRIPPAWRRGRRRPVMSHQRFWETFRERPGLFVGRVRYDAVVAFPIGYDVAADGALLDGFQERLAARHGSAGNLRWSALVVEELHPEGRPAEPWSEETDRAAVAALLARLDEFFREAAPAGAG
ncbi:hypothetical protein [Streptomyces sp. enrichment culture]|uniref:hypothetical protein n=1 Tax=Streptomyces sp. enrichment culture TaxID=1795815 RepID=UPI003F563797